MGSGVPTVVRTVVMWAVPTVVALGAWEVRMGVRMAVVLHQDMALGMELGMALDMELGMTLGMELVLAVWEVVTEATEAMAVLQPLVPEVRMAVVTQVPTHQLIVQLIVQLTVQLTVQTTVQLTVHLTVQLTVQLTAQLTAQLTVDMNAHHHHPHMDTNRHHIRKVHHRLGRCPAGRLTHRPTKLLRIRATSTLQRHQACTEEVSHRCIQADLLMEIIQLQRQ